MVVPFTLLWLLLGPVIVFVGMLGLDLFTLLRILCTYREEASREKEKEDEDFKQDKIVIFNEIIDVMRTMLYLYKRVSSDKKKRKKDITTDYLESYFNQEEEEDVGYTLDKSLIIEAWQRYRPKSLPTSPDKIKDKEMLKQQPKDLELIFGDAFIQKIARGVKKKFYQGKEFDINIEEMKKLYKF